MSYSKGQEFLDEVAIEAIVSFSNQLISANELRKRRLKALRENCSSSSVSESQAIKKRILLMSLLSEEFIFEDENDRSVLINYRNKQAYEEYPGMKSRIMTRTDEKNGMYDQHPAFGAGSLVESDVIGIRELQREESDDRCGEEVTFFPIPIPDLIPSRTDSFEDEQIHILPHEAIAGTEYLFSPSQPNENDISVVFCAHCYCQISRLHTIYKCSRCKRSKYCSEEHLTRDSGRHESICIPEDT